MINKILKARHWQVFIVIFIMPIVLHVVATPIALLPIMESKELAIVPMAMFLGIMMLYTLSMFMWFWSVGVGLQDKIPSGVKLNVKLFKGFLITPFVYIVLVSLFFILITSTVTSGTSESGPVIIVGVMSAIMPLHLFTVFCIFYIIYFIGKTIRTAELRREVSFSDHAGEFFMVWFLPIGIWLLQPRINRLVNQKPMQEADHLVHDMD